MKTLKAVVVDVNKDPNGLHIAWWLGAKRSQWLKGFDVVVYAKTWEQAMKDLGPHKYDEIQFYGHASPGTFCIGTDNELTDNDLELLAAHVYRHSLVWFRGCAAFHGEKGHNFARRITLFLDCRVAAHTYIIGFPWHSGGHSVQPRNNPHWPVTEGAATKPQKSGWKIESSGAFKPNTMWFLATKFPKEW